MAYNRAPKTKTEMVDRMLQVDFRGFPSLGADGDVIVRRARSNAVELMFPDTGERFEVAVHKRRDQSKRKDRTAQRIASAGGSANANRTAEEVDEPSQPEGSQEHTAEAPAQQTTRRRGRRSRQGSGERAAASTG